MMALACPKLVAVAALTSASSSLISRMPHFHTQTCQTSAGYATHTKANPAHTSGSRAQGIGRRDWKARMALTISSRSLVTSAHHSPFTPLPRPTCIPSSRAVTRKPYHFRCTADSGAGATWVECSPRVLTRRIAMLASTAVVTSCSCCRAALAVEDWSYGGPSGASQWSGTCAIGAQQSPIDVTINKALHGEALGELQFDYKLCTPAFKNPGHGTMQVNFPEGLNKLRLKGRELNLVQFHFHTPSEHAFDGRRFPMEAHLVHQDAVTKAYAVVGIMLDASPDAFSNGALAAALRYSPLEHGKTSTVLNVQVSANDLLPLKETKNDRRYIHYMGSFTTPPCTESVDWFLLEKPSRVPTTEVLEFMKFVGDDKTLALNARPIQPLGAREIFEGP